MLFVKCCVFRVLSSMSSSLCAIVAELCVAYCMLGPGQNKAD